MGLVDELLLDAGGHSVLERAFLSLVRMAGLPRPTCQPVMRRDGRRIGRVDFCFEPQLLIVEVSGRRGKTVTTVSGVPLADDGLRELAGRLKKRCGVGGSVKDGVIELQGDHRDTVMGLLRDAGYDVVAAGG